MRTLPPTNEIYKGHQGIANLGAPRVRTMRDEQSYHLDVTPSSCPVQGGEASAKSLREGGHRNHRSQRATEPILPRQNWVFLVPGAKTAGVLQVHHGT